MVSQLGNFPNFHFAVIETIILCPAKNWQTISSESVQFQHSVCQYSWLNYCSFSVLTTLDARYVVLFFKSWELCHCLQYLVMFSEGQSAGRARGQGDFCAGGTHNCSKGGAIQLWFGLVCLGQSAEMEV